MLCKADGLECGRLCCQRQMAHRTRHTRIWPCRGHLRVLRMRREWTVTALASNQRVGVRLSNVCDVGVTRDARQLAAIHNWPRLIRCKGASPVRAQAAVITRHKEPAESEKQRDPDGKQCRKPKQVLVRTEWRHVELFRREE